MVTLGRQTSTGAAGKGDDEEHCRKGLVSLGCSHAQPKKSAASVFSISATRGPEPLFRCAACTPCPWRSTG
jgi:hypothetical protein